MERLSGLDASFLYLETPSNHMHVSMAAVFDPGTVPGGYSFAKLRSLVSERLALAPVFTRRLVEVPFRLGHPSWVDDGTFDIDYHLRRAALPSPGGMGELSDFVGQLLGRPLDRARPLWEMFAVEGLAEGRIAIVTKIHHATIDGVSGAELLARLFDLEPEPVKPDEPPETSRAEHVPSDVELVLRALTQRLTRPVEITRLAYRTGRAVIEVRNVRQSRHPGGRAALPLTAPRTSLNTPITPHRHVAFTSVSLEDVKKLKRAVGVTVNDVVLALFAGAMRDYLSARDDLPVDPLVAAVPVSVRPSEQARPGSNKVSAMFVGLPTQVKDPMERLRLIADSTSGAKEEHRALGADVLLDWAEHASPNLFSAAARAYGRLRIAGRHRPIYNLPISNVPGPDFPLYLAGAELVAAFPLGPIIDGAGLNATVMSYRGVLNWGLMACAETVPDLEQMAAGISVALDDLMVAAKLGRATTVGLAPGPVRARSARSRRMSRPATR